MCREPAGGLLVFLTMCQRHGHIGAGVGVGYRAGCGFSCGLLLHLAGASGLFLEGAGRDCEV